MSESPEVQRAGMTPTMMYRLQCAIDAGSTDEQAANDLNLDLQAVKTAVALWDLRGSGSLLTPEQQAQVAERERVRTIRWQRAVKISAKMMTLSGLDLAGDAAASGDAIAFSAAARGAATMHALATDGDDKQGQAGGTTINLFYTAPPPKYVNGKPPEKKVQEIGPPPIEEF